MNTDKMKSLSLFAAALRSTQPAVKAVFEGSSKVCEALLEEGAEACDKQAMRLKAQAKGRKKALKELGFKSEKEFSKAMYKSMVEAEMAEAKKDLERDLKLASLPEGRSSYMVDVEEEEERVEVSDEEMELAILVAEHLIRNRISDKTKYLKNVKLSNDAEQRLSYEAARLADSFLRKNEFDIKISLPHIAKSDEGPIHLVDTVYQDQLMQEIDIKRYEVENNMIS